MKRQRTHEDTKTRFDPLADTVQCLVPTAWLGHILAFGRHDGVVAQISFVANDAAHDSLNQFGGYSCFMVVSRSETPPLEKTLFIDQRMELKAVDHVLGAQAPPS